MHKWISPGSIVKLLLPAALALGVAAGALAQEATQQAPPALPETDWVVQAGANGPANADLLIFAPSNLQVHRGDTVTWLIAGLHNVHFEPGPAALIVAPEMNGAPLPQLNPAVAFPTVDNGGAFAGGDTNSGLPAPPAFMLTIDAEPGSYTYWCDVHPGMGGTITVVGDDVALPTPQQVQMMAGAEIGQYVGQGMQQYFDAAGSMPSAPADGETSVSVWAGLGVEASNQMFVPQTVVIEAGQSVTWMLQDDTREIHTISWPPFPPNSEFVPQEQEGGPPIIALGPVFVPTVQNGDTVGPDGQFNYVIQPGETFSLTFSDPGVYPYYCALHAGMTGSVVVTDAAAS